jgi:hypothetical protein
MRWKVISFVIVKRFGLLGFSSSVIKPPYLASLLLISSVRTAKGILNSGVPHSSIYVTVFLFDSWKETVLSKRLHNQAAQNGQECWLF